MMWLFWFFVGSLFYWAENKLNTYKIWCTIHKNMYEFLLTFSSKNSVGNITKHRREKNICSSCVRDSRVNRHRHMFLKFQVHQKFWLVNGQNKRIRTIPFFFATISMRVNHAATCSQCVRTYNVPCASEILISQRPQHVAQDHCFFLPPYPSHVNHNTVTQLDHTETTIVCPHQCRRRHHRHLDQSPHVATAAISTLPLPPTADYCHRHFYYQR
jgi:hypothetical protein